MGGREIVERGERDKVDYLYQGIMRPHRLKLAVYWFLWPWSLCGNTRDIQLTV